VKPIMRGRRRRDLQDPLISKRTRLVYDRNGRSGSLGRRKLKEEERRTKKNVSK